MDKQWIENWIRDLYAVGDLYGAQPLSAKETSALIGICAAWSDGDIVYCDREDRRYEECRRDGLEMAIKALPSRVANGLPVNPDAIIVMAETFARFLLGDHEKETET